VLGYHGCDVATAERIFAGKDSIRTSQNDYDWLGSGAYFWEGDPERAMLWARERVKRKKFQIAAVVGAVIDLGNCLNLSTQEGVGLLKIAYDSYCQIREEDGEPLAANKNPAQIGGRDRLLRRLDNAVIERLHVIATLSGDDAFEPFDTVRGMFREGPPVYPGAGFWEKTHVQIAVRSADSIIGYFRPRKKPR
jgi:hypothetical protein